MRPRGIATVVAATSALRQGISRAACADALWRQIQPLNYRRTVERGWTHQTFEH